MNAQDTRISQRWAVDPLDIGAPFNVETEDGRRAICLVSEAPCKDIRERNGNRHVLARRIADDHNALLDIPAPEAALKEAREAFRGLLAHCDASPDGETAFERAVIRARKALALLTPQEGAK